MAEQTVPWQVEPAAYESALATALPPGLRMPRTYAVRWMADRSAAIWIEDIDTDDITWTTAHFRRAARLLGRFAASASVRAAIAPLDQWISDADVSVSTPNGRVAMQVIPALRGDELWAHPLVAEHFGPDLRSRLLQLVDALPGLLDELDTLPAGVCHGDACTRNLLISRSDPDLVMIDFGFLRYAPLGIDLSQLIVGEIQLGERVPDELAALSAVALEAYRRRSAPGGQHRDDRAGAPRARRSRWPSSAGSAPSRSNCSTSRQPTGCGQIFAARPRWPGTSSTGSAAEGSPASEDRERAERFSVPHPFSCSMPSRLLLDQPQRPPRACSTASWFRCTNAKECSAALSAS